MISKDKMYAFQTLRSWRKADIMTRLNTDARKLSRKQINANKAMLKRNKEIVKLEYRIYQDALGQVSWLNLMEC